MLVAAMRGGWRLLTGDGDGLWRQVRRELALGNMITVRTTAGMRTLVPIGADCVRIICAGQSACYPGPNPKSPMDTMGNAFQHLRGPLNT